MAAAFDKKEAALQAALAALPPACTDAVVEKAACAFASAIVPGYQRTWPSQPWLYAHHLFWVRTGRPYHRDISEFANILHVRSDAPLTDDDMSELVCLIGPQIDRMREGSTQCRTFAIRMLSMPTEDHLRQLSAWATLRDSGRGWAILNLFYPLTLKELARREREQVQQSDVLSRLSRRAQMGPDVARHLERMLHTGAPVPFRAAVGAPPPTFNALDEVIVAMEDMAVAPAQRLARARDALSQLHAELERDAKRPRRE